MPLVLLREYGSTPRFHGNGFTQLPLRDGKRLHVWHPDLPQIAGHNATIHNHVWDMQSRVLLGMLTHRVWDVVRCQYLADATMDLHVARHDPTTDTLDKHHDGWATATVTGEYQMAAGSVYVFPAGRFHESEAAGMTVTIMQKRAVREMHGPLVASPLGSRPTDAFAPEDQPTVESMWAAIEEAVLAMDTHTRLELKSCLGS